MRASGLLLHWHLQWGVYAVCLFVCLFFPPLTLPSEIPDTPHRHRSERVSYCLENFPPSGLPPQDRSLSLTLSSFIFCPTSFWRKWAAFLGAGVLHQGSEVVFVEVAQHSNNLLVNLWGRKCSPCPILPPSSVISSGKISAPCPFCPLKTPVILIFIYFMVSHRSHGFSLLFYFSFIFLLWLIVSNFIAPDHVVYILF